MSDHDQTAGLENSLIFKLWDERFARMCRDMEDLKRYVEKTGDETKADVRTLYERFDKHERRLSTVEGKFFVFMALGVALGGIIAAAVIKGLGL